MRAVSKIFAAALVASSLFVAVSPAHAATGVFVNRNDNRCLDADNSRPAHNGTTVQMWQCIAGGSNQSWTFYKDGTIRSSWDGRCLDLDIAAGTGNGTKVQLWKCNGGLNQKWNVNGDGTITSRHDDRCLDEDIAGGTRNGTRVQVWDCNGWLNQKWRR
ncbi:RICIN domain-containing protein [Actinoplanes sp. Pm04-4]|uniref:RICIN domain-containing protein n=1 Tax=Paractinoplanes pyxinae TaxID=2997416 RepID=A0ABT4BAD1_9ACTN|nr:RICIN domain-containing protein [Actinoplanes pyxinae]MCY1143465.1 RICIN domain-containing protein [Actinoplanes pyxinae]